MSNIKTRLRRLEAASPVQAFKPFTVHILGPDAPEPAPVPGIPEGAVTVIRLVPAQIQEKPHV